MFPTINSLTAGGTGGVNTSPVSIPIPSGTIGELIVVILSQDQNPTISVDTAYSGNNWRTLPRTQYSNIVESMVFYKQAEGGDLLRLNLGFADQSTWAVFRIAGGYTISGTAFAFDGANGDPPLHTPPDGLQDYLWIAARAGDSTIQASAAPSGYSAITGQQGGTQGATIAVATRQLAASSEDPGSFTNAAEQQVLWTIAVSPVKRIFVDFHANSVVTTTPRTIRRNSTSFLGQSVLSVSGVRVKLSSALFAGHTISDGRRSIIYLNSTVDSLGAFIFDSDDTTLFGIESSTVGGFTRVDASGKLQSIGVKIQRNSTLFAAHSVNTVSRKIIRRAPVNIIASSGVVVTRRFIRRPLTRIDARSLMDAGARVGSTVGRLTEVMAICQLICVGRIIRGRSVAISASASMSSTYSKKSMRRLLMTASSIYSSIRRVQYVQESFYTGHSDMNSSYRSKTKKSVSISGHSALSVVGRKVQSKTSLVVAHSSVSLVSRIIRGRSIGISASASVSITPKSKLASSARRATFSNSANSGHAKEVR